MTLHRSKWQGRYWRKECPGTLRQRKLPVFQGDGTCPKQKRHWLRSQCLPVADLFLLSIQIRPCGQSWTSCRNKPAKSMLNACGPSCICLSEPWSLPGFDIGVQQNPEISLPASINSVQETSAPETDRRFGLLRVGETLPETFHIFAGCFR